MKKTVELIKKLQPYWKQLQRLEGIFNKKVRNLEKRIEKEIGIEGIEFFMCDNEYVGIGNEKRTMKLIMMEELEKGKIINYD